MALTLVSVALAAGLAYAQTTISLTAQTADAEKGTVTFAYTIAGRSGHDAAWRVEITVGGIVTSNFAECAWCDLPVVDGSHAVTWNARAEGVETPDLASTSIALVAETTTKADADYMIVDVTSGKDSLEYPVRFAKAGPNVTTEQFNKPLYKFGKIAFKRVTVGDFALTDGDLPYTFKMGVGQVATGTAWHPVRLTQDYFLGVFEATQQQYTYVVGSNPSSWKTKETALDSIKAEITDYTMHPVENVAYNTLAAADTGLFARLSARAKHLGTTVGSLGAPTEAQWEYACRAGCENKYHWGADTETSEGERFEDRYGWNNFQNNPNAGIAGRTHHGVGEKLPNAWGFYDMTGNIYEYCSDLYAAYASTSSSDPEEDPAGATSGTARVIRGGAATFMLTEMASGYRRSQDSSTPGGGWGGFWAPVMGARLSMTVQ
jgi:formylglycine-generating enzyme required for sulfatase activity